MTDSLLAHLQVCWTADRVLYTSHARHEMRADEFGPITEQQVQETIMAGEVIEDYPDDQPYPSELIFGYTRSHRPLHVVCAYNRENDVAIVITVYQPNPSLWMEYRRRRA